MAKRYDVSCATCGKNRKAETSTEDFGHHDHDGHFCQGSNRRVVLQFDSGVTTKQHSPAVRAGATTGRRPRCV